MEIIKKDNKVFKVFECEIDVALRLEQIATEISQLEAEKQKLLSL